MRVEALLKRELHADHVDTNLQVGESPLAQLHMLVRTRAGEAVELDQAALEAELADIVRHRPDALRDALGHAHAEPEGQAFPPRYGRARSTPPLREVGTHLPR